MSGAVSNKEKPNPVDIFEGFGCESTFLSNVEAADSISNRGTST
jgi:hypothetical protein